MAKKVSKEEFFFKEYFARLSSQILTADASNLAFLSKIIMSTNNVGGKVIVAGNGGSAAMASHVSVDLTKAARVRSVNFNEADLITCFANDYGYELWLAKAIEAYADQNDLVILVSSSGNSPNMVCAAQKCKELGVELVTFSGFSPTNPLRKLGRANYWVDSSEYNIVEMTHHVWLLAVVDMIIHEEKQK